MEGESPTLIFIKAAVLIKSPPLNKSCLEFCLGLTSNEVWVKNLNLEKDKMAKLPVTRVNSNKYKLDYVFFKPSTVIG